MERIDSTLRDTDEVQYELLRKESAVVEAGVADALLAESLERACEGANVGIEITQPRTGIK